MQAAQKSLNQATEFVILLERNWRIVLAGLLEEIFLN